MIISLKIVNVTSSVHDRLLRSWSFAILFRSHRQKWGQRLVSRAVTLVATSCSPCNVRQTAFWDMPVSYETRWVLGYELACAACKTSFYILRVTRPTYAGGMNAPVSLRRPCTLRTCVYVCRVASDPDTDAGLFLRSSTGISITRAYIKFLS
jgi:hypothetical protein